jgi:hypothetical protein
MSTNLSPPEFSKLAASKRIGVFRPWFLILLILGLLAMIYVGYRVFFRQPKPENIRPQQSRSLDSFFITTAYAQASPQQSNNGDKQSRSGELKQDIMVGMIFVLAVVLLTSLGVVLFGKDASKVTVAGDILKTVLGFFIGVGTTFFSA